MNCDTVEVSFLGVRVSDLKMKSSDLPILQFFSKKTPEITHDLIEDIDDEEEEDDDKTEEGITSHHPTHRRLFYQINRRRF